MRGPYRYLDFSQADFDMKWHCAKVLMIKLLDDRKGFTIADAFKLHGCVYNICYPSNIEYSELASMEMQNRWLQLPHQVRGSRSVTAKFAMLYNALQAFLRQYLSNVQEVWMERRDQKSLILYIQKYDQYEQATDRLRKIFKLVGGTHEKRVKEIIQEEIPSPSVEVESFGFDLIWSFNWHDLVHDKATETLSALVWATLVGDQNPYILQHPLLADIIGRLKYPLHKQPQRVWIVTRALSVTGAHFEDLAIHISKPMDGTQAQVCPTVAHWGVLIEDENKGRVLYELEKRRKMGTSRTTARCLDHSEIENEWPNARQFWVGFTFRSNENIKDIADRIAEKYIFYSLVTNNCQMFALKLVTCIRAPTDLNMMRESISAIMYGSQHLDQEVRQILADWNDLARMPDEERVKWIAASSPTPVVTVVASILIACITLSVHKTFAASILGYLFLKGDIPGPWNNLFRGPRRPREEQLMKLYGLIYQEPHKIDGAERDMILEEILRPELPLRLIDSTVVQFRRLM